MADFLSELRSLAGTHSWDGLLAVVVDHFRADSGTIHLMGPDDVLHLAAASRGMPQVVLDTVRTVAVGKGMAGLAVLRKQPVDACNIQTDTSGDVRPGAKATGLQGSIVVPILQRDRAVGAIGIGNRAERTFTDDETSLLMSVGRTIGGSLPATVAGHEP